MSVQSDNFSKNVYQFGAELYKNLPSASQNVIYSPFSIQTCLTMAYLGAGGKTAQEMEKVLNYSGLTKESISQHYQTLVESIDKETTLKVANKIYVKNSYKLKPDYSDSLQKYLKSEVESVNFDDNTAAANTINQWVEHQTNDRIKNLISKDALNSLTRAVLVNAIYFKGTWKHKFDEKLTSPAPFKTSATQTDTVQTMFMKRKFRYAELPELNARALELPYKDSDITMLVILPNEDDGIKSLESRMHEINLNDIDSKLFEVEVELFLPKFQFEFQISLKQVLKDMGISAAFDQSEADFSGILDSPEALHVSDVVHKAFIKVDEEGAEAAAATAMIMMMCALLPDPNIVFNVDHPFMFLLKKGDLPLFKGIVKDGSNLKVTG